VFWLYLRITGDALNKGYCAKSSSLCLRRTWFGENVTGRIFLASLHKRISLEVGLVFGAAHPICTVNR
jgi:hypothetical protein